MFPCHDVTLLLPVFEVMASTALKLVQSMCHTCYISRAEQDGYHFAEDILICIFLTENECILINVSLDQCRLRSVMPYGISWPQWPMITMLIFCFHMLSLDFSELNNYMKTVTALSPRCEK